MELHRIPTSTLRDGTSGASFNYRSDPGASVDEGEGTGKERSLGEIIKSANHLSDEQIDRVLQHQKERGIRFGEAAIELGVASGNDVLWALSQQFHYPYPANSKSLLSSELVTARDPFSFRSEAFRAIRSQLMMTLFTEETGARSLAVVSPDTGDGKTYFSANLAIAFSQLGGRTLLIDADMRNPRQHEVFCVDNTAGLSGVLSGRTLINVIRPVEELPSLYLLPVGAVPPNPLELVERPAFGLLMRELSSKFDYVVVDTPAYVHGSDAPVIAARCDGALTMVRSGRSRAAALQDLTTALRSVPTRLCGVVMNEF
jgi:chain length determinant protein tyrosine kinase EpsG